MICLLLPLLLVWGAAAGIVATPCDPVFYPEGCPQNELPFKRVSYVDNTRHDLSLYMHTVSQEMLLVHVLVVFADADQEFHNTLLLNPARLHRLQPTLRESHFRFNNEVLLMSRGHRLLLQYDVAPPDCDYFVPQGASVTPYDAALLMDPYASMWHEYNTLITEHTQLLLRYSYDAPVTREDFQGLYTLQCDVVRSRKRCHALLGGAGLDTKAVATTTTATAPVSAANAGLWINGHYYAQYELVVDPSVTLNRLPYELYMRWHYHAERELSIAAEEDGDCVFYLNEQFEYALADDAQPHQLVVGVDAMHHFQKTEHRLDSGVYLFYYTHIYSANDEFVFSKLVICVFIKTLLVCLFHWVTSENYDVLHFLLRTPPGEARRVFRFHYRQVACEWTAVGSTVLLWILTLIFTEPIDASNFLYSHTAFQQRKLMLYCYSAYHLVLMLTVLGLNWRVTRKSAEYYYYWACSLTASPEQRDWAYIQRRAMKRHSGVSTKLVMVRNITLHTLLALDLLFIMNYMAEEKLLYGFFFLLITLFMFYYYVKYLLIASLYLRDLQGDLRVGGARLYQRHGLFLCWVFASAAFFALYAALSVPTAFVSFAQDVNSTYSEPLIIVFTILFLALVACMGLLSVALPVESVVKKMTPRPPLPYAAGHVR